MKGGEKMKRDMDLIREILLDMEDAPFTGGWLELKLEGYDESELSYHTLLLYEAGLIDAIDLSTMNHNVWKPKYITWAGHEFLDAARDNKRWETAKKIIAEKGGNLAFDVIKSVLIRLMTKAVLG
jgi:DNA-binding transcriptional ArsR family regulator